MTNPGTCGLCGQPMPPGEEMFVYHGYSGPCPVPPPRRRAGLLFETAQAVRGNNTPQGAPEASVDLAQIARETLEAIGAQDAYDTLEEWEAAHLPVVLAALQRAREVQK